ncbi:MAG TPA: DUF2795 domain-containing protein [Chloroflexota bacterium]|nr:DUF2795 domain-containing protein [Chloroflexota bacterium]
MMDPASRRVYLARVRDFVDGVTFPATRREILAYAERKNTPSDIIGDLTHLKGDRFASLEEVVAAVDAIRFGFVAR